MTSETPDSQERKRFLLTNLGILSIFILTLVVLLAAYPALFAPPPAPTPTATLTPTITAPFTRTPTITLTPTETRTPRPTLTATITITPSRTPTPALTPTPTGLPTITPARPVMGESYDLKAWSPEQAQYLIDLMEDYPNTLPRQARGENDENYYAAFSFPVAAQAEAILRFPDAPQAKKWRWGLAYDLIRVGDPGAAQQYADLISQALNTSEIKAADLPAWFVIQEPRLDLDMVKLPPVPGYLSAYLLRIASEGRAGPSAALTCCCSKRPAPIKRLS
jgi:hypothetical protein